MRKFDNEWILEAFQDHPSFLKKRMFGGLAVYLFGRMMMVIVQPTKSGRWKWDGVLICTEYARQPALIEEFPQLAPHHHIKKWLYIETRHEEFEETMERVVKAIRRGDGRFGIRPHQRISGNKPGDAAFRSGSRESP